MRISMGRKKNNTGFLWSLQVKGLKMEWDLENNLLYHAGDDAAKTNMSKAYRVVDYFYG
jgi:hypothetical protein